MQPRHSRPTRPRHGDQDRAAIVLSPVFSSPQSGRSRVCWLRNHRSIPRYREGERGERGEVTLEEAAVVLAVSEATVRRLIKENILPAGQHCKGAPWVIRASDLDDEVLKRTAQARRQSRPPSVDQRQDALPL